MLKPNSSVALTACGMSTSACGFTARWPIDSDDIARLLRSVEEKPLLLAEWAGTPAGSALAGTTRTVTKRHDS